MAKLAMATGGDLDLPVDAATQTFAFLGRKSSGKTYAASKLVELLLEAKVQVVVLDLVGNWYGLRLAADGKASGYSVPVIGGLRGDIPIEESAGELIANMVADTGSSAVIDISQFSLSARQRFATAFGERLWLRKKGDHHPRPMHLVIEESQLIIPQMVRPGQQRMVGVYEEIVRLGRNYGIGASMISQRPQSVNKEVLNQTECLFVFQTNGTQERDALHKWVVTQGGDTNLVRELPSLPTGTGYVWSPQWLQKFARVKIAPKRTLDSSATPKVGSTVVVGELVPLNIDKLREQMKEVIQRAKADDPRELRKTIAELQRALARRESDALKASQAKPDRMPAADAAILESVSSQLIDGAATLKALVNGIRRVDVIDDPMAKFITREQRAQMVKDSEEMLSRIARLPARMGRTIPPVHHIGDLAKLHIPDHLLPTMKPPASPQEPRARQRSAASAPADSGALPSAGGQRRMLIALAQRPAGLSTRSLGVRAGMSTRSGTFSRYLTHFRSQGWIVGGKSQMEITKAGLAALGPFDPLPEGRELLGTWLSELGNGGVSRILSAVAHAYPVALPLAEVARRAEMSDNSGTFSRYVTKLRSLELVEGRSSLRASAELFGDGDA